MLKKDLIKTVSAMTDTTEKKTREILEAVNTAVLTTLAGGASVMLLGLGKLSISKRGEKKARNLHTGATVMVPARNVVTLRASDAVHAAVNG